MTVYYYNGNPISAPITFHSNHPVTENDTISLKRDRVRQKAQRWELTFNVVASESQAQAIIDEVTRDDATQTMIMPQLPEVLRDRNASGSFRTNGTTSANATTIPVSINTFSGTLPAGSFIKFGGADKIYMLKETVTSGSFPASIEIYPGLVEDIPSARAVLYGENCTLSYTRDVSQTRGLTFSDGILANAGSVTVIEAL